MSIRCLVVTPERTEIDQEVDYLTLPMFDGELGIANNRSPVIGRLGYGTLKLRRGQDVQRYFVDGGFAQVEGNVVSILTQRAFPVEEVQAAEADAALAAALEMKASNREEMTLREQAILRARGMVRVAH